MRTYQATVVIADDIAPAVAILQDTPLYRRSVGQRNAAAQLHGIGQRRRQSARAVVGGTRGGIPRPRMCTRCANGPFAAPVPCPNDPGQYRRRDQSADGGDAAARRRGAGSAGNRTALGPGDGADRQHAAGTRRRWRRRRRRVAQPERLGGGLDEPGRSRSCARLPRRITSSARPGREVCSRGTQAAPDISRLPIAVPGPGEWTLSMWRRDAAGNEEADNASVPVTLRYDPEPPQLAFEPSEAADPTRVAVRVTDHVSGLADGTIEIAAAGTGDVADAEHTEGRRPTRDAHRRRAAPGRYLRAPGARRDQAGNEASTESRDDGQPMVVTLPLRTPATLEAGFERTDPPPGQAPWTRDRAAAGRARRLWRACGNRRPPVDHRRPADRRRACSAADNYRSRA